MTCNIDETHDPALVAWVASANGHSDFPVQNLPYAIFRRGDDRARIGVAIGEQILDLAAVADLGLVDADLIAVLQSATLNDLLALTPAARRRLRHRLSFLLSDRGYEAALLPHLVAGADCTLGLPATIGDYTDFYVGIHHALNVGSLFRPDAPLLPNYRHIPIGYHGRASSIRPSGQPVRRPNGQLKLAGQEEPTFGPSRRLDFELELGIWIAGENELGRPIPIGEAPKHIGGFCLLNDWSARDIQAWEYQPLGPFLSKNFHSTISPWIITPEALAPFRQAQPARSEGEPRPLAYLWDESDQHQGGLALDMEVLICTERMRANSISPKRLCRTKTSHMYWTAAQIVTHHASNGCNLNPGDLLGTGTISGPTRDAFGSLLEISSGGAEPVTLPTGETRTFVEDGDEIILRARAEREGFASIGFGECRAVVQPAVT